MTDVKISDLPFAESLSGADLLEIETSGGQSRRVSAQTISGLVTNKVPTIPWFAPSSVTVVAPIAGKPAGDPFIVWDDSAGLFRLFYFHLPSGVAIYMKTAPTLEGPWSIETAVPGLTDYHKFVILVDVYGVPIKIGGSYHGYAVYYDGANLSSKTIRHFTANDLGGAWTIGANVIAKGAAGSWDGFANDACYALYDNDTIYLWYMAEPDTPQVDFGLASRMMLATSPAPDSGFIKNYGTAALTPGAAGAWDDGWIGGMQVRRLPGSGPYVMFYNAGDTVPTSAGAEPNTSLLGVAYAGSLTGPWTRYANNPILRLSNIPSTALEKTDIWRSHVAYDPVLDRWNLFYNTGATTSGGELVTYARANVYDYQYYPGASGDLVALTTAEQQVPNSAVNLQPGLYRVRTRVNVIADSASGTTPKLDVTSWLRLGGATHLQNVVEFVGSYAYENRDTVLDAVVAITSPTYIDVGMKVTNGIPVAGSKARNLRISVQRLS